MLYVDGRPPATGRAARRGGRSGAVQMGRGMAKAGYTGYLDGDLADVAVFNRLLVPAEATQMLAGQAGPAGYWPLNTAPAARRRTGRPAGRCSRWRAARRWWPGPARRPAGDPDDGLGELYLDGVDDYASTASAVVATDGSFTVTARVRLASPDSGPAMTVLSQKGASQDERLHRAPQRRQPVGAGHAPARTSRWRGGRPRSTTRLRRWASRRVSCWRWCTTPSPTRRGSTSTVSSPRRPR